MGGQPGAARSHRIPKLLSVSRRQQNCHKQRRHDLCSMGHRDWTAVHHLHRPHRRRHVPFPSRQTCAPLCRVLVTHRPSFGTFVMACANRLSPATKVTSTPLRSFPTVTGWRPGQTTPHVVFSTFGATRSWPCTATITSFVASPRWPLASPAGYSLPATTITIATFGTRFVANEQVFWLVMTTGLVV